MNTRQRLDSMIFLLKDEKGRLCLNPAPGGLRLSRLAQFIYLNSVPADLLCNHFGRDGQPIVNFETGDFSISHLPTKLNHGLPCGMQSCARLERAFRFSE